MNCVLADLGVMVENLELDVADSSKRAKPSLLAKPDLKQTYLSSLTAKPSSTVTSGCLSLTLEDGTCFELKSERTVYRF